MRNMLASLGVLLLVASVAAGGEQPAGTDELQGIWIGMTAETNQRKGKMDSAWDFMSGKLTISNGATKRNSEWRYQAAPGKSPKEIDLIPQSGIAAGKTLKGIYTIENDILTICHVTGNNEDADSRKRPTEFNVKDRDDVVILKLERMK